MYFDIGANVGSWSLANSSKCDRIIAVEASPFTFEKLRTAVLNRNITALNYAVCNNSGEDITFYHAKCDTLSTLNKEWLVSSNSRFYNHPYIEIKAKTITIDSLIEKYGTPDLIKVDVEGGEYDCIQSLTKRVNMLCFEWASETNHITYKCLDYLSTLGFTRFYIQNTDNYTFRPNNADFYDMETTKTKLSKTTPKSDWGMVWCM
jgi:FkbM family methyltransferase